MCGSLLLAVGLVTIPNKSSGQTSLANPTGLTTQCSSDGTRVAFSWGSVIGADSYLFRLNEPSDDSTTSQWGWYDAGSTDKYDTVSQTSYSAPVIPGKTYSWWVHGQSGNTASSLPTFGTFTCTAPTPAPTVPDGLKFSCSNMGTKVALSWNTSAGADSYLFRMNDTSDDAASDTQWGWYNPNSTDVRDDNVRQTSYLATVVPERTYSWWVHGQITNITSSAPAYGTFACVPPATPSGLRYECNAKGDSVTLSWNKAVGAKNYLLRINDTSDDASATQGGWFNTGTTDVINDTLTQTYYTTPVVPGRNYIWWIHGQSGEDVSNAAYGGFTCTSSNGPKSINVKNFGAKGDGISDDAPAIQAAIDKAGNGSTIYIPAGTYMLGTSAGSPSNLTNGKPLQTALWLKAGGVTIKGDGTSSTLKLMAGKKMRILSITGDGATVDSLLFDGNKTQRNGTVPYPDGDVVDALVVGESYRQQITVKNCEIKNGIETGVGFWLNKYATVDNCYIHDNGLLTAGGSGIDLSGGSNNKATNNRLIANTYGVWSSFGSSAPEIRNNIIKDNDRSGLALGGADPSKNDTGFIIDGNTISGNGRKDTFAAVGINYVQGGTFTNNTVVDNIYDGFQIYDTIDGKNSTNWNIQNNTIQNTIGNKSQQYGIRIIGSAKGITLKGNTVQNNGTSIVDQIVVDPKAQVNSDWQTTNTIRYGNSSTSATISTLSPTTTSPLGTSETTLKQTSNNTTVQLSATQKREVQAQILSLIAKLRQLIMDALASGQMTSQEALPILQKISL